MFNVHPSLENEEMLELYTQILNPNPLWLTWLFILNSWKDIHNKYFYIACVQITPHSWKASDNTDSA